MSRKYRVLAIDGALNHSGWAVLDEKQDKEGNRYTVGIKYGSIKVDTKLPLSHKLAYIKKEVVDLLRTYKPDIVVLEDVYIGSNAKTSARLNNAKGVFILTVYETTGDDPIYVNAAIARSCLGFKNNKDDPFDYFKNLFQIEGSFTKLNDITDAFTLGFWYIVNDRGECQKKKKARKAKKVGN